MEILYGIFQGLVIWSSHILFGFHDFSGFTYFTREIWRIGLKIGLETFSCIFNHINYKTFLVICMICHPTGGHKVNWQRKRYFGLYCRHKTG